MNDKKYQVSKNIETIPGQTYDVDKFYNEIGGIDDVSSGRIIGSECIVEFKDNNGKTICFLTAGDYTIIDFQKQCGKDVVTQYSVSGINIQ